MATADIMEKDMTEVSSVSKVRGLDRGGNSALISTKALIEQGGIIRDQIQLIPNEEKRMSFQKGLCLASVDINPGVAIFVLGQPERPDIGVDVLSNNTSGAIQFNSTANYIGCSIEYGFLVLKNFNGTLTMNVSIMRIIF